MIKILISLLTVFAGLSAGAATYGEYCNNTGRITEYMCGATPSGPGWYRGNDGCWYLNTNRSCYQPPAPPQPHPGPYPGPGQGQYVRCESYGFRYTECFVPYGAIRRATLTRQYSREACVPYRTFGAMTDRIWVDRGCGGEFFVEFY
jgi:hypothetical protein